MNSIRNEVRHESGENLNHKLRACGVEGSR